MNESSLKPKILVIGGGSGSSNILRGLKRYPVELTVIVTMFDSGGSSGLLRKEFGYPPFGDLRQCLMALSDDSQDTQRIKEALEFKFGTDSSLNGHSVGNLLLAALTSLSDNLELALSDISRLLGVTGKVVPVTLESAELCAELDDGRMIVGESDIDLRLTPLPRIRRIFLNREVEANPRAVQAILEADVIVFGPGDLYTSILPNTLPKGIIDAVESTKGIRIYICNLMTKQGETDDFKASDFTREMTRYVGSGNLDWVLVNIVKPAAKVLEAYEGEGARFVIPDLDEVGKHVRGIIALSFAADGLPLRHDPDRTSSAIFQALETGRMPRHSGEGFSGQDSDSIEDTQTSSGSQVRFPNGTAT